MPLSFSPGAVLRPITLLTLFARLRLLADDFDRDGHREVLLVGNFFGVEPLRGRYDAGYGALLGGDEAGGFEAVEPSQSDLWLGGEVRAVQPLRAADGSRLLVVARNNEGLQILRLRRGEDVLARRTDE